MDENKNYENTEETVEETAEETAEEIVEETAAEETAEIAEEPVSEETAEPMEEEYAAEPTAEPEEIKKGSKVGVILAVCAAVIVIAAAVVTQGDKYYGMFTANKYNRGFINVSGMTIKDVLNGSDKAEFLKEYGMPEDMPENTYIEAVQYRMPLSKMAEMYGMDVEQLKTELDLDASVTGETPIGEIEDNMTLEDRVGAEQFEQFKTYYGLGDDVTLQTKWKDVKQTVNKADKKKNDEKKNSTDASADASADKSSDASAE